MRIERRPAANAATASSPSRNPRTGQSFTVEDAPDPVSGEAAPSAAVSAATALAAISTADAGPTSHVPARSDDAASRHSQALLGALARLQAAALGQGGQSDAQARRTLADLARTLPRAASPGLDGVLRAIAQRASVELARSESPAS